jgi:uncharacterized membrane protein
MAKWKIMREALPYVLGAVALKLLLEFAASFPGAVDFPDVAPVLTGGVFLLGFMLAGTMADFKEAEKLPGEIACTLETIEETLAQAGLGAPVDVAAARRAVLDAAVSVLDWLYRKIGHDEMFRRLEHLRDAIGEASRAGGAQGAAKALGELHGLRRLVTRVGVISRTGFIAAGYALLETMAGAIFGALMISRFKSILAEILVVGFVSLIFVYMIKLIRDIDDPFEYDETGETTGAAEVEIFPIIEFRDRVAARVAAAGAPRVESKPEAVAAR